MTSLSFGTSGLRGLVTDLSGEPAQRWTAAFLAHAGTRIASRTLLVGRDLRASSPSIAADCLGAANAAGWEAVDCGALPTPALALEALRRGAAAVMVTGSHIPDDRNGLKFYAPGEITKADEAEIRTAFEALPADLPPAGDTPGDSTASALNTYRSRYLNAFAPDALAGLTIGIYQQSSVARDLLVDLLSSLGAETVAIGRAERFVPVDTEAHRPEDIALLRESAADGRFAAIVSTDGDADRPLVADGVGEVLRGDVVGLLTALHLGARTIVTPVTSSGAAESSGVAAKVVRTRVGSPFVIEAMEREVAGGSEGVLGFEANGGVLLGSPVSIDGRSLAPLPTRDAILPILCTLAGSKARGLSVGAFADTLGAGQALADRLKNVPASASGPFLTRLAEDDAYADALMAEAGPIASRDHLDGVRFRLEEGSIVHFRASGNAPELRVYVEAEDPARASTLLRWGLATAAREVGASPT
ncbi:phosphomannomutase [Aureimonas mangrovi]|uniref:phosphomannomutase n=1 Tax=Aureimonas mangrovi TaxID=2758041 RepID=UPI00163D6A7D|nr:phosphomannomutase [Aureimonas mangrovi]